jgi:hypothetical protein
MLLPAEVIVVHLQCIHGPRVAPRCRDPVLRDPLTHGPHVHARLGCGSGLLIRHPCSAWDPALPRNELLETTTMPSVQPLARKIDPVQCMGDWYVQVAIPTPFDTNAYNGIEQYEVLPTPHRMHSLKC